ncbi:LemA family protein [Luteolibacter sp. AS25]|uniref:LemA family protein n=1 Tax=Luteolibacter sp. AS25 TaxID=3135776 RepID=UPI00398B2B3A
MDFPWAVLLVLMLPLLWVLLTLNGLVKLSKQLRVSLATVDVQLMKRHDLVPEFVGMVGSYAAHESDVTGAVTAARRLAMDAGAGWDAEQFLKGQIERLIVQAESYPNLRASERFQLFQRELAVCTVKIASARIVYDAAVLDYNAAVETFPVSGVARSFGFMRKQDFETAIADGKNP